MENPTPNRKYCEDCNPKSGGWGFRWTELIRKYGVDRRMYEAMYFDQDGTCLICEKREARVVDHCHETGKVRGLLCVSCNFNLGWLESGNILNQATAYLSEGVPRD